MSSRLQSATLKLSNYFYEKSRNSRLLALPLPDGNPMPAITTEIPFVERADFWVHRMPGTVARLAEAVAAWPAVIAQREHFRLLSDAEFGELAIRSVCSTQLRDYDAAEDGHVFHAARREGVTYAVLDLGPIDRLDPLIEGVRYAGTRTLFSIRETAGRHFATPEIIEMTASKKCFRPGEGDHWERAKAHAMQGLCCLSTIGGHARITGHFASQPVHCAIRALLPEGHLLRELIEPHCRHSLAIEFGALAGYMSVLRTDHAWFTPYAITGFSDAEAKELVSIAYSGVPGHKSFPAYVWPEFPEQLFHPLSFEPEYIRFIRALHPPIRRFVDRVLSGWEPDAHARRVWALLAEEVVGWPDETTICREQAVELLSTLIWQVSVFHAADHWDMANNPLLDWRTKPYRLRVPPPPEPWQGGDMIRRNDAWRTRSFDRVICQPPIPWGHPHTLMTVNYQLPKPLLPFVAMMRRELADAFVAIDGWRPIPLDKISASIMW